MARAQRPPSRKPRPRRRRRAAGAKLAVAWRSAWPAAHPVGRARRVAAPAPAPEEHASEEILRVPVLADGADPGKTTPSPLAVRDRLLIDRRLVGDHVPEHLFAYDVTPGHMNHLRGLVAPGDRVVFRRGGRVTPDRICAVRTPAGIVLSRVSVEGRALRLLPGEGGHEVQSIEVDDVKVTGVVAGTQVLLIRR